MPNFSAAISEKMDLDSLFERESLPPRKWPRSKKPVGRVLRQRYPTGEFILVTPGKYLAPTTGKFTIYIEAKGGRERHVGDKSARVLESLRTGEIKYRTVRSIAEDSKLTVDDVSEVLRTLPSVRRALFRHYDGSQVYTTSRVTPKELFASFTQLVLNSYK